MNNYKSSNNKNTGHYKTVRDSASSSPKTYSARSSVSYSGSSSALTTGSHGKLSTFNKITINDLYREATPGLYIQVGSVKLGVPLNDDVLAELSKLGLSINGLYKSETKNGWTRVLIQHNSGVDSKTKSLAKYIKSDVVSDSFLKQIK